MKRIGILAGAALVAACGEAGQEPAPTNLEPVSVTVADAWTAPAAAVHPARVEAAREADVATRASGTLARVPVDVGQRVAAGQMVAVLDGSDVEARIRAAEAQVELATRTHGRIERLQADGAASQQELDEALARMQGARAGVAEARAQAAYVEVRAPFDGVVTARWADPGDLAVPGRPVLRIAGDGAVEVVADLPSAARGAVAEGDTVRVLPPSGAPLFAVVARVVPTLDPVSRRFRVEAHPLAGEAALRPGQFVRMEVAGAGAGSRWIPADAVVRRGQLEGVYALEGDTLRLRWLRLGRVVDGAVEVLAGPPGELTVVLCPDYDLRDGQPVSSVSREGDR